MALPSYVIQACAVQMLAVCALVLEHVHNAYEVRQAQQQQSQHVTRCMALVGLGLCVDCVLTVCC